MKRRWKTLIERAHRHADARGTASGEAGDTLVEVLLALIVLSLTSVAVIVAFTTTISASAEHRSLTTFNTMIRSATEQALSQVQGNGSTTTYENCPPVSYYQPGGLGAITFSPPPTGTNYTAAVTNVGYWNGSGFTTGAAAQAACNPTANLPQEITITVTDPANGQNYSNSFVVDDSVAVTPIPTCLSTQTANALAFATEPSGAAQGVAFQTQPVVWVENTSGATPCVVTSDLSPVKLTITAGTGMSGANLNNCFAATSFGSGIVDYQNCDIDTGGGTAYTLTATAGSLTVNSSSFYVVAQLGSLTISSATPSGVTAGALNVTFSTPSNAPGGQTYSAEACTGGGMTGTCVNQASITSGGLLTGLTAGQAYYVQVTAIASNGYLASASNIYGPTSGVNGQMGTPGAVTLGYGATAGSVSVSGFTASTPTVGGQTYTATACTDAAMTQNCHTATVTPGSGGTVSGLPYSLGVAGGPIYATVTANAVTGYAASNPSSVSASHPDTSQVNAPSNLQVNTVNPNNSGKFNATYNVTGAGISNETLTYRKNDTGTYTTATPNPYTSGTTITQTPNTEYGVVITVNPTTGFVSNSAHAVGESS